MEYEDKLVELIKILSDARGTSGFEDEVVNIARNYASAFADVEEDKLRNLYIKRRSNTGDKPLVMLDAHSDEVGFMVHSVRPNGLLRVVNLGRWTNSALPSSKVLVRNSEGEYIPGIFAAKPAHFMTAADKAKSSDIPISELSIDIGATSDTEACDRYKIRMGEPVVPASRFEFDEANGIMFGKAFDCRVGCAALLTVMEKIADMDLPCDVIGVLSSQEEVGERGCTVSVNHVKPDAAICFEGCPADDTFTESYAIQTALKKGPMFRHMDVSAICSPRLQRLVLDTAEKTHLKVQQSVREGGGNDAAVINLSNGGVSVVTAGIPVRYIHSMNCLAAYEDVETTINLSVEILKRLDAKTVDSL